MTDTKYTYFLSKELKNLGCTLKENKNIKYPVLLDLKIIHKTQTFRITERMGVVSKYFLDGKGYDYLTDIHKYIANKINNNQRR